MRALQDRDEEELKAMSFPDLTALRRAAFEAHISVLVDPRLTDWSRRMSKRHKSIVVGIHAHGGQTQFPTPYEGNGSPLSWIAALFVAVYGEDLSFWPVEISESLVRRAGAWELGKTPEGVVYVKE